MFYKCPTEQSAKQLYHKLASRLHPNRKKDSPKNDD